VNTVKTDQGELIQVHGWHPCKNTVELSVCVSNVLAR